VRHMTGQAEEKSREVSVSGARLSLGCSLSLSLSLSLFMAKRVRAKDLASVFSVAP